MSCARCRPTPSGGKIGLALEAGGVTNVTHKTLDSVARVWYDGLMNRDDAALFLTEADARILWDALDEYADARYHIDDEGEAIATEAMAIMGRLLAACKEVGMPELV